MEAAAPFTLESETDLATRGVFDATRWKEPDGYSPPHLLLQWHITDRCNRHCTHCYENTAGKTGDQPWEFMLDILDQIESFLARHNIQGTINVTGGEPFLHPRLLDLLENIHKRAPRLSFAVLTNGSLIDAFSATTLARLGCRFVQVSLEGDAATHASIRGPQDLATTLDAIRICRRAGIPVLVSCTIHRANAHAFPAAARLARRAKADIVWTDRLVPPGHGTIPGDNLLTPLEFRDFLHEAGRTARTFRRNPFSRTRIRLHRALQHLAPGNSCRTYRCTAGATLVTLLADGSWVPCRRLPIRVGNAYREPLSDIHEKSPLFHALRSAATIPEACTDCSRSDACRGGLRCLAYAWHGTPFAPDPQCFLRAAILPDPGIPPRNPDPPKEP